VSVADRTAPADHTVPAPPPAAIRCFGERLEIATAYAGLLVGPGVDRGLLGPREADRVWERHLLNCGVVADLIPPGALVWDVGSGAGLPGLVIAIARPDLKVHLLEPLLRRTTFLAECLEILGLDQVSVVRARAEDYAGRAGADIVTARAVAPLDRLSGWLLPLLRPGGEMLALKGETADEELRDAEESLRDRGATEWSVVEVGGEMLDPPTRVIRVRVGADRAPARPGHRLRKAPGPPGGKSR
jgi:16S rRNA (guanine527-N7)-methyltransferase